ncbi:MAG: hydroxymethylglutaryl-CoA reductase, degradative [Ferroplasma sp.]|uniref:hydroxymethylglutaryl-CoA reductase, degradative n=1 Tax=Ferroplasma sp. TaxID=2591003 RepID=UPI002815B465|nr:hydroxymethylglutaryl-CoA reductase, degradative [Ferroplasma sp.]WMT52266.1 MAG: hydroxymethylglutaryl-CoA reductase, degradative [Ferroplasma sp.]
MDSLIHGFHNMSIEDRRKLIKEFSGLTEEDMETMDYRMPMDAAGNMIENVYTVMDYPVGIATNFRINGRDYLIPMSLEEPSVVAACSNGAKYARPVGFTAYSTASLMRGEIELYNVPDPDYAIIKIFQNKEKILEMANTRSRTLSSMNAGAKSIEVHYVNNELIVNLVIDVADAMGANIINTMLEYVSGYIEELTGAKSNLRIMSNLTTERVTYAYAKFDGKKLGQETVDRIIMANEFAKHDIYRATTHNKGIMNGIDAVLLATMNDFRAQEANAHAYASINGYGPLTDYRKDADGNLIGSIKIPVAVGTVGGATKTSRKAMLAMKIMKISGSTEFATVLASVGLAQNFAALRALADEGIQSGHMKLHARNIAIAAGATGDMIEKVAGEMILRKNISYTAAKEIIEKIRG